MRTAVLLLVLFAAVAFGDMYMHNPRGSNNRLNGRGTNRSNNNRMCDTQNNAKGGYCWGPPMYFYQGSRLSVEWTNQHGCGANHDKVNCQVVIQFMCGDLVRDGTSTGRIPDDEDTYNRLDANGEYEFGMHEDYFYYQTCKERDRNRGLFIADRNVGRAATRTRQNNNGNRSGFECPEERDYYPYWHPSPWRDIAILTEDTGRCNYYKDESHNVLEKHFCTDPRFNNQAECSANGANWNSAPPLGCPGTPECLSAPWSRVNHLGNSGSNLQNGGQSQSHTAAYNMTIPDCISHEKCVLRVRYNISTDDYDGWSTYSELNGNIKSPVKNDPYVRFVNRNLSLAINTAQFGRTFQDRSHVFAIRPRPGGVGGNKRIFNLNVRGKRGNIVQTYPATEYDFVPNRLVVKKNDLVHFQWTGCDHNPNGNDGEGRRGTDRSNIVPLSNARKSIHTEHYDFGGESNQFADVTPASRMAHLDQVDCTDPDPPGDTKCCQTLEQLQIENGNNNNNIEQDWQNCAKLNAAPNLGYFDAGLVKMSSTGAYQYMSSRNNNFTNRSQKGSLVVNKTLPTWAVATLSIGGVALGAGVLLAVFQVIAAKSPDGGIASFVARING